MTVAYKGELKNKKMDGNGSVKFSNGDTFVGQFKDDLPHGVGTLTLTSGLIYSGEWNMGKKHGQVREFFFFFFLPPKTNF
jgi:hypothetical protein